jgi:hypothetical protein
MCRQLQFSYENSGRRGCKHCHHRVYMHPHSAWMSIHVKTLAPFNSKHIFFGRSSTVTETNNWGRVLLLFGSASFIMRCHRISKNTRVWHCDLNQKQEQLVKVDGFVDIYAEWWHLPFFCYVNSHILPSSFLKKYMWLKKGQCSQLFNTLLSNSL